MKEPKITGEVIKDHGITPEEYKRIWSTLGREPTYTELGMFGAMWSEHCSYKSSKVHLKKFPVQGERVIQGPGENAGVVDIGDGLAVVFKMESHNHPSFIEPYQGAATGVGGILRDIFTMGARPIASLNSLFFGSTDHPKTRYLLNGVTAGISGYGNCIGVPTVGGETHFHECYNRNILVNVFNIGIAEKSKIFLGQAGDPGNPIIYVGSKTGRDGIHGTVMASEEFSDESETKRPTVQVGDPFTEKLLLEACLELFQKDLIVGIQDMGAAGLTCSTCEMAGRSGGGIEINLDQVPVREQGMIPYEILLSESQERMLISAKPGKEKEVLEGFRKWDLDAEIIGRVTGDGLVRILWQGKEYATIPIPSLVNKAPEYNRPTQIPKYLEEVRKQPPPNWNGGQDCNQILRKLLASPNLSDKRWIYEQYDVSVGTDTVVLPGSDSAVFRVKGTNKGIAISSDVNSRYCYLNPYLGGMLAVAESARNVVCAGGSPIGMTNCLNFGNPENPEIMWQFEQCVMGISEVCKEFGIPVVSGNVSLYNETDGVAIFPTPTVGMVGLIEDLSRHSTQWFNAKGNLVFLLGDVGSHLGGTEYEKLIHGTDQGTPPPLDLQLEKRVQNACLNLIRNGVIASAHDCSDGGLAVTLAECCFNRDRLFGVSVQIESDQRPDAVLFGETQSRIIVSCSPKNREGLLKWVKISDIPCQELGTVTEKEIHISIRGTRFVDLPTKELFSSWNQTLPLYVK